MNFLEAAQAVKNEATRLFLKLNATTSHPGSELRGVVSGLFPYKLRHETPEDTICTNEAEQTHTHLRTLLHKDRDR